MHIVSAYLLRETMDRESMREEGDREGLGWTSAAPQPLQRISVICCNDYCKCTPAVQRCHPQQHFQVAKHKLIKIVMACALHGHCHVLPAHPCSLSEIWMVSAGCELGDHACVTRTLSLASVMAKRGLFQVI